MKTRIQMDFISGKRSSTFVNHFYQLVPEGTQKKGVKNFRQSIIYENLLFKILPEMNKLFRSHFCILGFCWKQLRHGPRLRGTERRNSAKSRRVGIFCFTTCTLRTNWTRQVIKANFCRLLKIALAIAFFNLHFARHAKGTDVVLLESENWFFWLLSVPHHI